MQDQLILSTHPLDLAIQGFSTSPFPPEERSQNREKEDVDISKPSSIVLSVSGSHPSTPSPSPPVELSQDRKEEDVIQGPDRKEEDKSR